MVFSDSLKWTRNFLLLLSSSSSSAGNLTRLEKSCRERLWKLVRAPRGLAQVREVRRWKILLLHETSSSTSESMDVPALLVGGLRAETYWENTAKQAKIQLTDVRNGFSRRASRILTLCLSSLASMLRSVRSEIPPWRTSTFWSITVANGNQLKIFCSSFRIRFPCIWDKNKKHLAFSEPAPVFNIWTCSFMDEMSRTRSYFCLDISIHLTWVTMYTIKNSRFFASVDLEVQRTTNLVFS